MKIITLNKATLFIRKTQYLQLSKLNTKRKPGEKIFLLKKNISLTISHKLARFGSPFDRYKYITE